MEECLPLHSLLGITPRSGETVQKEILAVRDKLGLSYRFPFEN